MNNKRTPMFVGIGLAILLIALFAWPKINDPNKNLIAQLRDNGIGCLTSHSRALQHFHPHITIIVDGEEETIPANLGVLSTCMAEIHTHDASGTLHAETIDVDKIMRLKDFFVVWNHSIEREGYALSMTVDGEPNAELGELVLRDRQNIVLEYKR